MVKDKLTDFTTDRLKKRKRTTSILIILLIVASILSVGALLYDVIWGNATETYLVAPAGMCILLAIIFSQGIKNINKELAERKDK
ncbi:MAG: hypothetical protein JW965_11120 [Bacteroidales bacterium]|nr:hypothetical protein [Bacteroidales bacterium]